MSNRNELTRREFLKRTSGAAAGIALPTLITSQALGAPGVQPASERVRIGFIGVRNRGMQNLAHQIKNTVALCDVDKNVLAVAKKKIDDTNGGSCEVYSDYRKLLENKEIDAVVISTPDHWHALMAIHACEAGKDVFIEKPLTLTIHEGQAMIDAARRYKRIVQTGSQQRSGDEFRLARDLVRGGRIGKLQRVLVGLPGPNFKGPAVQDSEPPPELDYDFWLGPAPKRAYNVNRVHYYFRFFWNYSGGQQTNFGAHDLDITQWVLGMDESGPVSAEGTATYHPEGWFETPVKFDVTYQYPNGLQVLCGNSQKGGITFVGEKGEIHVQRGRLTVTPAELATETFDKGNMEAKHHANWLECIKSRKLPAADVAIGHRSATVCHLGNIAVRTGRKVTWDPAKQRIVGDRAQAAMASYEYRRPWHL